MPSSYSLELSYLIYHPNIILYLNYDRLQKCSEAIRNTDCWHWVSLRETINYADRNLPIASAVGSIFGARAQTIRSRVTAVCRSNYEVAASRGINIKSNLWGESIFRPERTVRAAAEVSHVNFDYIVLATKLSAQSNDPLIESIRPAVSSDTALVSVQNGVTSELALGRAFDNPILSSTCYISCTQRLPGLVEQISHVRPHAFYLGVNRPGLFSDGKKELKNLVELDDAFAGVDDAHAERWRKMIFNTAWSLSTSLMNRNTHEVLQDSSGSELVLGLAEEALSVARVQGINLSPDLPLVTLETARKAPALVPSMLQDIRRGKPIEVEALCGK